MIASKQSPQIVENTKRRYDERANPRETSRAKIAAGRILEADAPERVQRRIARLSTAAPTAFTGESLREIALERVIGRSDLVSITYLEQGLRVARSVGRIRIKDAYGRTLGYGTGFMVSPRLLMTNNHVLEDAPSAQGSVVEFNYQYDLDRNLLTPTVFALAPNELFVTDATLDYTLVSVQPTAVTGEALSAFGWNILIEQVGKVIIGEYLTIIQHPSGEPKQLALRENQLIDVLPQFLHYKTDTAPGSSGSPVFNDQWEVVALHHSGVPATDGQGRYLTRDGQVWQPGMPEELIDWIANEGARVSQIIQHFKAAPLTGAAAQLREELLNPPRQPETAIGDLRGVGPLNFDLGGGLRGSVSVPLTLNFSFGSASPASTPRRDVPVPRARQDELDHAIAEFERSARRPYYDAEKDGQERQGYYKSIGLGAEMSVQERFRRLSKLISDTHTSQLRYKPSTHVYPWVDLHPDRKLRSIYSGKVTEPLEFIREDFRTEQLHAVQLREFTRREAAVTPEALAAELSRLEALQPYNCEHVVPQSWFDKREPMRGDLHHLFACESGCNSFRGNNPYFDFADFQEVIRNACGKLENKKFEPSSGKGPISRAVLYFLLRYPQEINQTEKEYQASRLPTLIAWHKAEPPDRYELHRNQAIYEKQGNRNPLIDFPDLADHVDFALGLG